MNINTKSILSKKGMDTVKDTLSKIENMNAIDLTDFNEGSMAFLTSITIGSEDTISKCVDTLRTKIEENEIHPNILWVSILLLLGRKDIGERSKAMTLFVLINWEEAPYKDLMPLWVIFMDTYIPNSLLRPLP